MHSRAGIARIYPYSPLPTVGSGFLTAVAGREVDDALHDVAEGLAMALEQQRKDVEPIALSVINRLTWRGAADDRALADDLLARLRRGSPQSE